MSNYKYFNNRHHEAFCIEVWQLFEVLQKMIGVDYGSDESNIYIRFVRDVLAATKIMDKVLLIHDWSYDPRGYDSCVVESEFHFFIERDEIKEDRQLYKWLKTLNMDEGNYEDFSFDISKDLDLKEIKEQLDYENLQPPTKY
ncbi:hypothetical protein [Ligilactobacillus saerimneri]|uniref:hypothetical protein n=1 Tax=Ligilactobacillus saerimneri TaxID=228229 RepID=UPI0024B9D9A4|nr:hypothetical protein [Ligilactobacillus saerimneri]